MTTELRDSPPHLVFVHVPKCAGTSVDAAIRAHFDLSDTGHVNPIACRGAAQDVISASSQEGFFVAYPHYQAFLLRYFLNCGYGFVSGHLPIDDAILDEYADRYAFITVLRDPVDRWISHYAFNKLTFDDPMVPPSRNCPLNPHEELQGIMSSWRGWQLAHMYTVFFSGLCPSPECTAGAVTAAQRNLERFAAVGFVEELPGFVRRLESLTGARLSFPQENRTVDATDHPVSLERISYLFDPHVRQRIRELCRDDYTFYNFARSRFA